MQSIVRGAGPFSDVTREAGTLGWVGAGRMGTAMIERLLEAGHSVTVYNRTPSKLGPLVAAVPVLF